MTIEKGAAWGETVGRPDDLEIAVDDADLARRLHAGGRSVGVASGDVFTTLGARPVGDRTEVQRLPIDLLEVSLDGSEPVPAVAHVLFRRPWYRGGWFAGDVIAVMNAEFVRGLDLAPRGHPNDGRAEVVTVSGRSSLRERLAIRRRARTGTHLPHPAIATQSVRSRSWVFDRPHVVIVDGRRRGSATDVGIVVHADAAHLHA